MKRENVITIFVDGATVTTGATSARVAIPSNSGGKPLYIRVAATAESYVKLGDSTVVATTNSALIQPSDSERLAVGGATHIAYIQGAAAAKVNIAPLEDF